MDTCKPHVGHVVHATHLFYGISDRALHGAIMSHEALATQWQIIRRLSAMILAFLSCWHSHLTTHDTHTAIATSNGGVVITITTSV